mmetsp:Transcript_71496/g.199432  ORF Transcript_71496/g.199432 Transcript_71496/m.199432 type:complete len:268 (-) Transcript_71496:1872-2675(-)
MVSAQAVEQRRGRGRGSGGRAPDLLVLAAPLLLDLRPLVRCRCRGVAVEQRAAPGLVRAAPVLLVLGPLCHPLRQTLLAVVGRRCRRGRGGAAHVRGLAAVDTLRQRPGAGAGRVRTVERWTPTQLMRTAPVCLAVGPSRLGVLLSSGAVVGLRSRSGAANLLLFAAPLHSPMLLPVPRLQGGLAIETLLFLLLLLLSLLFLLFLLLLICLGLGLCSCGLRRLLLLFRLLRRLVRELLRFERLVFVDGRAPVLHGLVESLLLGEEPR